MEKIIKKTELKSFIDYLNEYEYFEVAFDAIIFGKRCNYFYFFQKGKNHNLHSETIELQAIKYYLEQMKLNDKINVSYIFYDELY